MKLKQSNLEHLYGIWARIVIRINEMETCLCKMRQVKADLHDILQRIEKDNKKKREEPSDAEHPKA